MTENIGLRLRYNDLYIVVNPTEDDQFCIDITDARCDPPDDDDEHLAALEHLQHQVDGLRKQVWKLIQERRKAVARKPSK